MEKEQRRWMLAACGHRVYEGELFTTVGSEWDDVPSTQCEPCWMRWEPIIGRRFASLTAEGLARICGC